MAATAQVCVCLMLLLCVTGEYVPEYAMDNYCGSSISFGIFDESIKLKLTNSWRYDSDMDCGVRIQGSFLSGQRLFAQFLDMDVDCTDHVQLFDGRSDSNSELTSQECGIVSPAPVRSSGNEIYIKFTSNGYFQGDGFTILLNNFHGGSCRSYEFQCNNGWCIDDDLYCNDYDNCGDNSDYCYKDYNWWIWLIVGIVVFIVICIVITVVCCCCCKKTRPGVVIKTNNQPVVHYHTATSTVTPNQANPWYGAQPQPQFQTTMPTYPGGPAPVMPQPPAYTSASASVYPPPQPAATELQPAAPPAYSEKMPN